MKIKIDGKVCEANEGETVLDVATRVGVKIPTLCYLKKFGPTSSCRMCLVEVDGQRGLVTACSFKVKEGMNIKTNTPAIINARKINLELLLSNHDFNCTSCVRDGSCELEALKEEYGADESKFAGEKIIKGLDESSPAIVRDNSKCILCKKCVAVCEKMQGIGAIKETKRGFETKIACAFDTELNRSSCVGCGQCVLVCPTGALRESIEIEKVEKILSDDSLIKVVAPAPSVRVAISEELGFNKNYPQSAYLPTLLREMGFNKVFDVNFGADLTVMEEAEEFLARVKSRKNLPMFTSCCPAWVEYAKKFYPEILPNISTCKSPMMMFGAVVKTYYAEKLGVRPEKIAVVAIMPCTAKKKEARQKNEQQLQDVDAVLSVREFVYLLKKKKINTKKLVPSEYDSMLGESTGAGVIFGASGGVMEASLRTLNDILNGKNNLKLDYEEVRGLNSVKLASVDLAGKKVNVAVVSGLKNVGELIDKIKRNEIQVDFVEVMSCPGGCINGGGMPIKNSCTQNYSRVVEPRMKEIYALDKVNEFRKSHQNKEVNEFRKWNAKTHATKLHTIHGKI